MKYILNSILIILTMSNQIWGQTQTCEQNSNDPKNNIISQSIDGQVYTREYILRLPINYNENNPSALLFNLHGFGDCASDYSEAIGEFYNLSDLADDENIILVYPQGAYRPEKEDTYWEPGDTGIENIYENDIYFFDQLILHLGEEYNINSEMIFACGYSNGGMMSYSLACNMSNVFAGIGIMSGTMLEEDCSISQSIPIIKFHGIEDEVLPYEGNLWYQSVEDVVNFWLGQNNIPSNSLISTELNDGKVIHDQYNNNESCFSLYTINEEFDKPGGHVWFSDEIEGASPNTVMWDFFKNQCESISSTVEFDKSNFEFYPNPIGSTLEIKNAKGEKFNLISTRGKIILNGHILSNQESIQIDDLEAGFYVIKIGNESHKLVKIR